MATITDQIDDHIFSKCCPPLGSNSADVHHCLRVISIDMEYWSRHNLKGGGGRERGKERGKEGGSEEVREGGRNFNTCLVPRPLPLCGRGLDTRLLQYYHTETKAWGRSAITSSFSSLEHEKSGIRIV